MENCDASKDFGFIYIYIYIYIYIEYIEEGSK